MERIADYIINKLVIAGAKHIFMVTGRGALYLTDAVAKNENIEGIPMYHEQSASYAAMSYAKANGKIGVCLVSTGCAATNAITGALCAYQDNLPVVFLSGQHMLKETTRYTGVPIRTFGSQEADIISLVEPITKYAVMVTEPNRVVYEVEKALYYATTGRKGPVWIDIPLDLQSVRIEPDEQIHFIPEEQRIEIPMEEIDAVAAELNEAKRPVLLIGGGTSECEQEIRAFAEGKKIPVVSSFSACDVYGSGNKYSIGTVGCLGTPRAGNFAVQNADYVLVVGSKMCSQIVGDKPQYFARDAKVTVVDIDKDEHTKPGIKIDRLLIADAKAFFGALEKKQIKECEKDWLEKCLHWKAVFDIGKETFIKPDEQTGRMDLYDVCHELGTVIGDNTAVITDAGLEELIVPSAIPYRAEQRCFFPAAQGAMGYAVPAILGAYFGGYEDIVVVVGDGSVMMNVQELQLLQYYEIKPKVFVINNNMYAVIRARQKDLFRTRTIGNDNSDGVPSPAFDKIASTFGLKYEKIEKREVLTEKLGQMLRERESVLCEVMCKTEQKYFHTSFRKNENGKLVRPSIEDMSPFLDRDVFLSEMMIELVEV